MLFKTKIVILGAVLSLTVLNSHAEMVIGTDPSYAPFEFFDENQKTFQKGQIHETRKKETKPRKNNEIYYKYILPKKTFKK